MCPPKNDSSAFDFSGLSLYRGVYARVARRLGVDRSYVSRVARGERHSRRVEQELLAELQTIARAKNHRVPLAIAGQWVERGAHVAYIWETEEDFGKAMKFLAAGIDAGEGCLVVGNEAANRRVLATVRALGANPDDAGAHGNLVSLSDSAPVEKMLQEIFAALRQLKRRASCLRLISNIGWHSAKLSLEKTLAFESALTKAASRFACVALCMYNLSGLSAPMLLHAALECHPLTISGERTLCDNPAYLTVEEVLQRSLALP